MGDETEKEKLAEQTADVVAKPKRRRRTKAEMQAAREAAAPAHALSETALPSTEGSTTDVPAKNVPETPVDESVFPSTAKVTTTVRDTPTSETDPLARKTLAEFAAEVSRLHGVPEMFLIVEEDRNGRGAGTGRFRAAVSHAGLVWKATQKDAPHGGLKSVQAKRIYPERFEDAKRESYDDGYLVYQGTVTMHDNCSFGPVEGTVHRGNTDQQRWGRRFEIGETRAVDRALRLATGMGLVAASELPQGDQSETSAEVELMPVVTGSQAQPKPRDNPASKRTQLPASISKDELLDFACKKFEQDAQARKIIGDWLRAVGHDGSIESLMHAVNVAGHGPGLRTLMTLNGWVEIREPMEVR